MSGITDLFNNGLPATAAKLITDPIGKFATAADNSLGNAAKALGDKLAGALGYNLADKVAGAASAAAAAQKAQTIDTSKVVSVPGEELASLSPVILLVAIAGLILWKWRPS